MRPDRVAALGRLVGPHARPLYHQPAAARVVAGAVAL
jgi:hypothetical protein